MASPASTARSPAVSLSGDLQPLFHQLVFECKVHSALYGACFAHLVRAFGEWRQFTWRDEVHSLREQLTVAQAAQDELRKATLQNHRLSATALTKRRGELVVDAMMRQRVADSARLGASVRAASS